MAITDYSPLNANFRARLGKVLQSVRELARPQLAQQRQEQTAAGARDAMRTAMRVGQQRRNAARVQAGDAGEPPKDTPDAGLLNIPGPRTLYSQEQQRVLGRQSTRYERYAARAGYTPVAWSTHQQLSLGRITELHKQVDLQGVCLQKDDTDRYVLRQNAHLSGVDRARRSKTFRCPLILKPADASDAARIVCNFTRKVFDDFDGLLEGVGEMGFAHAGGGQPMEVVYDEPREMTVVVGKDTTETIVAEGLQALEPVYNRYLRYDVVTDRPWLDMGGRTVDLFTDPDTGEPSRKFLLHRAFGDGHTRQRGFMFPCHYLHYFETLSVEKWITVLETFGAVNPYLEMASDGFASDEDKADAYLALENHGTGEPAVIHRKWGTLKHAPIPAGVDARGMHAAIIGMIHEEMSKAVQGETLTAEIGDVGSYRAMEGHENQQEHVQWIDAHYSARTLRRLAKFVIEVNAEQLARIAHVSPEAVKRLVPKVAWFLDRKVDPVARLGMFKTALVDMRMDLDLEQIYDEFYFIQPTTAGGGALRPPEQEQQQPGPGRPANPPPAKG